MENGTEAINLIQTFLPLQLPGLTPEQSLTVETTWFVMAIIIAAAVFLSATLRQVPRGLQNVVEMLVGFLENFISDIVGPRGPAYFPLVATIFFFILVANYIGLIPGFVAPTSSINTTAACAVVVFVFYQYIGFKMHGIKYLKHFMGPIPVLAPIFFVMEIISQLARPLSLSLRLFANLTAGELIIKILMTFCVVGLPVVWMCWESLLTDWFQAFIFSLLTMIYLAGAIASDHEEEHA
ncbi:MAG: F0F1 ATP synthase subunit A [Chitinivibrionales bacterium]|nr:F0F1 ATP synthase subunit A [Chitinivibrionales bacterium]